MVDNSSSFKIDNIKRCLECNKIPLIEIIEKQNEYFIHYYCENNHEGEISLNDFLKSEKNSLNKIPCGNCQKNQDNNYFKFFFCISCKKVLCTNCFIKHSENDQIILLSKYDSTCLLHNISYSHYCKNCKKNICMLCLNEHNNHNYFLLANEILSDNYLKEIKNKINNLDNINKIKNEIIESRKQTINTIEEIYSEYKNSINLEISLINNLIDTYYFEKKCNNYNYEIIQNIKNIEKIKFSSPDFSSCKNIFEKGKIFISFYTIKENNVNTIKGENEIIINQNIKNPIKEHNKKFNIINLKISNTLTYHLNYVNQIILLQDGRIASSSSDKSILIYNKENYSVELEIKDLNDCVYNIIQGSNGYIFASIRYGLISIFKLTSLTSYQNVQNIKEHNKGVNKIIELKDGRFVSCSNDKTIKIWKFNNQLILEKTINHINEINSILELKENEVVTISNGSIIFWNVNESKIISEIKEINCTWCWNIITKLSNDLLIIVGKEFIYLISINEYNLIRKIDINSPCYSVCYLINGNLLTGHSNGYIKQWNLNNNIFNFIGEKKNA